MGSLASGRAAEGPKKCGPCHGTWLGPGSTAAPGCIGRSALPSSHHHHQHHHLTVARRGRGGSDCSAIRGVGGRPPPRAGLLRRRPCTAARGRALAAARRQQQVTDHVAPGPRCSAAVPRPSSSDLHSERAGAGPGTRQRRRRPAVASMSVRFGKDLFGPLVARG